MSFSKALQNDGFLRDSVNYTNFVLFVVLREYVCSLFENDTLDKSFHMFDSKEKVNCENPFEFIFSYSKVPKILQSVVRGRFERLRNYYEAIMYTHLSSLKDCLFNTSLMEIDTDFRVSKDSVFGILLRKFASGFHCQSFSQMVTFLDNFFEAYDNFYIKSGQADSIVKDFAFSFYRDKYFISSRENALDIATTVLNAVGKLGGRPYMNLKRYDDLLLSAQKMYSGIPYSHYASHIYALKRRNLTKAEIELHNYFETCMASKSAEFDFNNTCAYMAVTAAAMHYSFEHWHKGECLEKEALQKALESESKDPLGYVKITHTLLHNSTEPFRYEEQIPTKKVFISNNLSLAEFRTKFWSMLDSGTCPNQLLNHYFNSPVAASQVHFTTCLLDLSTMWRYYGYSNLSTLLLMCTINAECLQPCASSDLILAVAFANVIREFASNGCIETALKLSKKCQSILCRFPDQSHLHQASLEVELEQHLRSEFHLSHCDRLVNALKLCCPWEAALKQAEVEQKRCNISLSHDLLRRIIDSAAARRNSKGYERKLDESGPLTNKYLSNNHNCDNRLDEQKILLHISFPHFPDHIPVGGIAQLAQVELRARLALVELLISTNNLSYAKFELETAIKLCEQFHLDSGMNVGWVLERAIVAVDSGHESDKSIDKLEHSIRSIMHQTDRTTRFRCQTFVSRVRLHVMDRGNYDINFLKSHLSQLLLALVYYRRLNDKKRILDILCLTAVALHAMDRQKERNEISRMYAMLRQQFAMWNKEKAVVVDVL